MEIDFGFAQAIMTDRSDGDYKHKEGIFFANQIHSDIVRYVDTKSAICNGDGLVTVEKNFEIGVYVADCMPVFVADEKQKSVAVLHCGRKGIFLNIFSKALQLMGSQACDVSVFVGAGIRKCCYEVGEDVIDDVQKFGYGYALEQNDAECRLDLLTILKNQISNCGITNNQVQIDQTCTCCSDRYFSYRKDATPKRMGAYIWIK